MVVHVGLCDVGRAQPTAQERHHLVVQTITKGHPPAKKFIAGQKLIFWSVIVLSTSISVSGLTLLFRFEINLFAATFARMNALRISGALGLGEFREALAPHEEMQFAQRKYAIFSFLLMPIKLAHIYIGTVDIEGVLETMSTGEVAEQWAGDVLFLVNSAVRNRCAASEFFTGPQTPES